MNIHLILCYKNFSQECSISHIGLGATAAFTAKTLTVNGIYARAVPIYGADDLALYIQAQEKTMRPVTHVVLFAQWILIENLAGMLVRAFPHIQFAQTSHSNVGFLQAEPPAISMLRGAMALELTVPNFVAACNNQRLSRALHEAYGDPVTYLPNLYYLHGKEPINRPLWNGGTLKIGVFGALRIYKNFSTAIMAGIELTNQLKCHSEIWMNSGIDDEGPGNIVYRAAKAWTDGVPNVVLKELPWASWHQFRHVVGSMNVLMSPSYTETFNVVTADGISQGTPSVVGPSIEWVPNSWKAEPDDSTEVSNAARNLLFDPYAAKNGYQALKDYVDQGLPYWKKWIHRV